MAHITWHLHQPNSPIEGDVYFDEKTGCSYIFSCGQWIMFSATVNNISQAPTCVPTYEQLEKHPSLKEAWEEFIIIKKLLGV